MGLQKYLRKNDDCTTIERSVRRLFAVIDFEVGWRWKITIEKILGINTSEHINVILREG